MRAARSAGNLHQKGWHLVTAGKHVKPSDGEVSPYLLQPVRTLLEARRDRKRQRRRLAPAKAKTGRLRSPRSTTAT